MFGFKSADEKAALELLQAAGHEDGLAAGVKALIAEIARTGVDLTAATHDLTVERHQRRIAEEECDRLRKRNSDLKIELAPLKAARARGNANLRPGNRKAVA